MSIRSSAAHEVPFLLPGKIVDVPGRGEMFVRHHQHSDSSAPTLLLLHGWTASCDAQFFTAYKELAQHFSIVGIDHRGHGRGLRPSTAFTLEDCADDAAAVVRELGITSVITVGYSMGGPISLLTAHRHSSLVSGMVLMATALEWRENRRERMIIRVARTLSRITSLPQLQYLFMKRMLPHGHEMRRFISWIVSENCRNNPRMIQQAGKALSTFDARSFAPALNKPSSFVLTIRDSGVLPHKQQALAAAVNAQIVELDGDHMAPIVMPREFAVATRQAVDLVVAAIQQR